MTMRRITSQHPGILESLSTEEISNQSIGLSDWCEVLAGQFGAKWLLAHADDGVVWGRFDEGKLRTSFEAAQGDKSAGPVCPQFRLETMQQARIFGETAEILIWKEGAGKWKSRVIRDENQGESTEKVRSGENPSIQKFVESFDEPQMLWGTTAQSLNLDFTLLSDGEQGLRHAIPIKIPEGDKKARIARLLVRHYLEDNNFARIVASRLVSVFTEGLK